jgi:hypothetical protein
MEKQAEIESQPTLPQKGLLREFSSTEAGEKRKIFASAGVVLLIILAGVVSGYFLANRVGSTGPTVSKKIDSQVEIVQGPKEAGIKDVRVFRDTAQGRIEVNDSELVMEGSHKLIRPGGKSQTAYLTSSVVDLNDYLGECVQIWGETHAAQEAGWLLDVGRVRKLDQCPEGL